MNKPMGSVVKSEYCLWIIKRKLKDNPSYHAKRYLAIAYAHETGKLFETELYLSEDSENFVLKYDNGKIIN